jgi:hypothetical protein
VSAIGPASTTGAVTATAVTIRPAGPDGCATGFGAGGFGAGRGSAAA